MSNDQDLRRRRRPQPRAARALHGGRRRRLRRPLRRPPPGLQPADRRRDRLRGLRVAVRRRLRHRLRQQGRADRADPCRPRRARRRRGGSWARSPAASRSAWACRRPSAPTTRCSTRSATRTSRRSASSRQLAESQLGTVGIGQPLRERDGGRGRPHLGRRALRLARLRSQDRLGLPRARAGTRVRRQGARGRDGLAAGALRGRLASSARPTSPRWSWRASTPTPAATSSSAKVLEILGAEAVHEVHNHHNFAWREEHFGRDLLGRAQGLHAGASRARRASSAARWATTR